MRLKLPALTRLAAPLLAWLRGHEAETSGVRVSDAGGSGLGLVASRDAAEGDVLSSLPPRCLLSYDKGVTSPLPALRSLLDAVLPQLWTARLGLVLLDESSRGEESPFATYSPSSRRGTVASQLSSRPPPWLRCNTRRWCRKLRFGATFIELRGRLP